MPARTGPISAFLTNANLPLGSEFDDGIRNGPVLSRTVVQGNSYNPYPFSQWGIGLLNSACNTYNIIPAGPIATASGTGNVVVAIRPVAAGNFVLAGDNFITQLEISGNSSPANLSRYVQFDWPRALSATVTGGNFAAPGTITVFGQDFYGVPLQEAVIVQNRGTYQMKKAFYQVTRVYYNGADSGGPTVSIETTDVLGLPYRIKSVGDINSIRWGAASDLAVSSDFSEPVIGSATLAAGAVFVACNQVTATSNILATAKTPAGTQGILSIPTATRNSGVGFTINSSDGADTSTVDWVLTNPFGQYSASGISQPMILGTITIVCNTVQADSIIQLTMNTFGTAHGEWSVTAIVPGVSFTVTSDNLTETSTVNWVIMPSNWLSGTSSNMVGGKVIVSAPSVQANSKILLTHKTTASGTPGLLSVPDVSANPGDGIGIVPGVGFTIVSSNVLDTNTVNWTIVQNIPGLTQGTATLGIGGTVIVNTTAVQAGSVILLTDNTFNTQGSYVFPEGIVANTSFIISSDTPTDRSTVNWAIFPANFILPAFIDTLGTFTPSDDAVPTNFTGDVRGTYKPSTPANGGNVLHFTAFYSGYDNFVNQQSNANLSSGGTAAVPLTRGNIGIDDQVGVTQFYTGTPA